MLGGGLIGRGQVTGLAPSSGLYLYLKDSLGSVSKVTDASGVIVQQYEYSAFGRIVSVKDGLGSTITPVVNTAFTFAGREWDVEADLYYLRTRYLDPGIGRFLQQDSHAGFTAQPTTVTNEYIYALNRPTSLIDPYGTHPLAAFFVAAVIGGAIYGGLMATLNRGSLLRGIGNGAIAGGTVAAGAIIGISLGYFFAAGGAATLTAYIGTTSATVAGGLGGGITGGVMGYNMTPQAPWLGALTGFTFGFVGGAIAGGGALPFFADVTSNTILNAPPIPEPNVPPAAPVAPVPPPPATPIYAPQLPPQLPIAVGPMP